MSESNNTATLGCGSIIIIALLFLIFSSGSHKEMEQDLSQLQSQVTELQTSVDQLTEIVRDISKEDR